MRLGYMEPLDEPGHERRIYECLTCKTSINVVVDLEGLWRLLRVLGAGRRVVTVPEDMPARDSFATE
jgi:hypothetical protein